MGTFVVAYLIVWLAVALYVARLSTEHGRLARRLESLQRRMETGEVEEPSSRAA